MNLKGMANTNVNGKVIIFSIYMSITIVKFSVLNHSLVNIVSVYIKGSTRFKFGWVIYCFKKLIIFNFGKIKDTGIPVCI